MTSFASVQFKYLEPSSLKDLISDNTQFFGTSLRRLEKYWEGKRAELFSQDAKPIGFIAYKINLDDIAGKTGCFILKTMAIFDAHVGTAGESLFQRTLKKAISRNAEGVAISLHQDDPSLSFFKSRGFKEIERDDKHNEVILHLSLGQPTNGAQPSTTSMDAQPSSSYNGTQGTKRTKMESEFAPAPGEKATRTQNSNTATFKRAVASEAEEKKADGDDVQKRTFIHVVRPAAPQQNQLHPITLPKKYIHMIRNGQKTVEGRVFKGFVYKLKVGDLIRFYYTQNAQDDVVCQIIKVEKYDSFSTMLKSCGFRTCVPDVSNEKEAENAYHKIPGYTENAQKFGVAAIHLKVISQQK